MLMTTSSTNPSHLLPQHCGENGRNNHLLKLNRAKTQFMVVGPKRVCDQIIVKGTIINNDFIDVVKNLGVWVAKDFSFSKQISLCTSSCFATPRDVGRIRNFLTCEHLRTLMSALVLSRIDCCNSLYHGVSDRLKRKLQAVQNSAAKLIFRQHKNPTRFSTLLQSYTGYE